MVRFGRAVRLEAEVEAEAESSASSLGMSSTCLFSSLSSFCTLEADSNADLRFLRCGCGSEPAVASAAAAAAAAVEVAGAAAAEVLGLASALRLRALEAAAPVAGAGGKVAAGAAAGGGGGAEDVEVREAVESVRALVGSAASDGLRLDAAATEVVEGEEAEEAEAAETELDAESDGGRAGDDTSRLTAGSGGLVGVECTRLEITDISSSSSDQQQQFSPQPPTHQPHISCTRKRCTPALSPRSTLTCQIDGSSSG